MNSSPIRNRGKENQLIQFFVAPTVDAVCCVTILTELFRVEGLKHSITPINNYDQLKLNFKKIITMTNVHTIIFVDCVGAINCQMELFNEIEIEQYEVIIFDSHRPFHQSNIKHPQIKIIVNQEYLQVNVRKCYLNLIFLHYCKL